MVKKFYVTVFLQLFYISDSFHALMLSLFTVYISTDCATATNYLQKNEFEL